MTKIAVTKIDLSVSPPSADPIELPSRFWADFNLFAVAILWGINAPVMKYGITRIDPFVFNALRLTVSVLSLWMCWEIEKRFRIRNESLGRRAPTQTSWRGSKLQFILAVVAFAFLSGALYQITFLAGIFRTTAGNTALIMSSCPMWTAFIAMVVTRDRLPRTAWLGLVLTFLGTVLVILQKNEFSGSAATQSGNLIVLLAALAWSFASVVSRPLLNYVSAIRLAFFSVALTLPVHFLLAAGELPRDWSAAFEPWTFAAILFSGFFSTGVAYAMWNYGVQKIGAPHAAIYQNVIPLVAVVSSWWLIGEIPLALQLWGGGLIIGGLVIMRRSARVTNPASRASPANPGPSGATGKVPT